jgi:hypothetical protein
MGYIQGEGRDQGSLFPVVLDDLVPVDHMCRVIDGFVEKLVMSDLGFERAQAAETGRPGYDPRDLLKLYLYGYLIRFVHPDAWRLEPEKIYIQSSRPWECGNPVGISKECGKGGKQASWLSMHSTLCHFHGLLLASLIIASLRGSLQFLPAFDFRYFREQVKSSESPVVSQFELRHYRRFAHRRGVLDLGAPETRYKRRYCVLRIPRETLDKFIVESCVNDKSTT